MDTLNSFIHYRSFFVTVLFGLLLDFFTVPGQAALIDRGGGFIYDTDLNITWTQDASLSGGNTWANQVAWVESLSLFDPVRNVTWDDWRLPTTTLPDFSCSSYPNSSTGTGCTGSEMGHLYYNELGGTADSFLTNTSPFINVQRLGNGAGLFYYSSEVIQVGPDTAYYVFDFGGEPGQYGIQNTGRSNDFYAWAVRDGDVAPIPEPSTLLLMGSGLLLMAGYIWRRERTLQS